MALMMRIDSFSVFGMEISLNKVATAVSLGLETTMASVTVLYLSTTASAALRRKSVSGNKAATGGRARTVVAPALIGGGIFECGLSIVFWLVTASGVYGIYASRTFPKRLTAIEVTDPPIDQRTDAVWP